MEVLGVPNDGSWDVWLLPVFLVIIRALDSHRRHLILIGGTRSVSEYLVIITVLCYCEDS